MPSNKNITFNNICGIGLIPNEGLVSVTMIFTKQELDTLQSLMEKQSNDSEEKFILEMIIDAAKEAIKGN